MGGGWAGSHDRAGPFTGPTPAGDDQHKTRGPKVDLSVSGPTTLSLKP